jgi:hypothetical protein
MRNVTFVLVEELKSGDWGIGGKPISTADVKALAAGKAGGQARDEPVEQPELVGVSGPS